MAGGKTSVLYGKGPLLKQASSIIPASTFAPGTILKKTQADRRCYDCHGQIRISQLSAAQRHVMRKGLTPTLKSMSDRSPVRPNLYISPDSFRGDVHQKLTCIHCHTDAKTLPHAAKLERASCVRACHHPHAIRYRRSIHAWAVASGNPKAPGCATCHGSHGIRPVKDPRSKVSNASISSLCLSCHQKKATSQTSHGIADIPMIRYADRLHKASSQSGPASLAVTCISCHQNHDILSHKNQKSSVSRMNIARTCSQCHEGIAQTYYKSIHGQKLLAQNQNAPSCVDCHQVHQAYDNNSSQEEQAWDIVRQCGQCHDRKPNAGQRAVSLYQTYKQSYHGKVSQLGSRRAALCSDCHGTHDILPVRDPRSRLNPRQRIRTCAKCHPGANAKFIQYMPHADYRDASRYPLLHGVWIYFLVLMGGTLGVFGLHNLLWWNRTRIECSRTGKPPKHDATGPVIRRFRRVDRFNHALMILCFFGLTLTGMPLLFADKPWARSLAGMWGGIDYCGHWHRLFAAILLFNFVIHLIWAFQRVKKRLRKRTLFDVDTLWPRRKDIEDALAMGRWFFGRGEKPRFGRWTYWEKFDYWAELAGLGIIGSTGLVLMAPTFFAQWIPGWVFNLAAIAHGYEALLAIGFIVTIHLFNANLRLEKFPVDQVMFTGRIPESEFKIEHPLEYERLVKSGQLHRYRVTPSSPWQHGLATVLGVLAMLLGISLVLLMLMAGLKMI